MWTIISLFVICMQVLWSFKEPGAASLPPITGLDLVHREQMVRIYLMIHDTWVPLQRCCLESLWSVRYFSGLNSRIQTVRGRWGRRTWWGSWSVTRAAVVHQQKAGNHGNDDDATNPLALQGLDETTERQISTSRQSMIQPVQDRHSHKLEDEICTFGQDCFSFFLSFWLINCQLSKQMQHNKCKAQNVMPAILLKCAQHALSTRKHVLKRGCKNTVRLLSSDVSYLTPSPLPTHAGKKKL